MSAIYAVKFDDEIQILTDGAAYDDQCRLMQVSEKVYRSQDFPMAVAGRGNSGLCDYVGNKIIALAKLAGGFDEAIAQMPEFVRVLEESLPAIEGDTYIEMLVAGWSADCGFRQFAFNADTFELVEIDYTIAMGPKIDPADLLRWLTPYGLNPATAAAKLGGKKSNLFKVFGAEVAEYWRRQRVRPRGASQDAFLIGGHCDLTTITPDGVSTRRLRTWPDKIGERIDPYRGENVTPIASGLNRKQRRAIERERRRA